MERGNRPGPNEAGRPDALLFVSTGLAAAWSRILARAKELQREGDGDLSETEDLREFSDGKRAQNIVVNRAVNTRKQRGA